MKHFIIFLVVSILEYLAGAFITMEFDVTLWEQTGREILVSLNAISTGVIILWYFTEADKYRRVKAYSAFEIERFAKKLIEDFRHKYPMRSTKLYTRNVTIEMEEFAQRYAAKLREQEDSDHE